MEVLELLDYVNKGLLEGKSVTAIGKELNLNESSIRKKLNKSGYKRVGNQFTKVGDNVEAKEVVKVITEPQIKPKKKLNHDIDINALKELISLIEPIKEVIEDHNKNKNIIDITPTLLNPPPVVEVKQKLFKIDTQVLEDWENFVQEHKEYKVQSLISLALAEFIDKYK